MSKLCLADLNSEIEFGGEGEKRIIEIYDQDAPGSLGAPLKVAKLTVEVVRPEGKDNFLQITFKNGLLDQPTIFNFAGSALIVEGGGPEAEKYFVKGTMEVNNERA